MPFYFRKSISAGPFRFNFSKGGVGASIGIKGLRFGTGPRGHYVHAGRGGIYYRATIGRAGETRSSHPPLPPQFTVPPAPFEVDSIQMVEVDSGNVLAMRDEAFGDLLDEINAKRRQLSMATTLGWSFGALGVLAAAIAGVGGLFVSLLALPAWGVGRWLDSYRRTTVLFYDLAPDALSAYEASIKSFDEMMACAGKWHVEAGGAVQDLKTWKRNAGATHIVSKKPTVLEYKLPVAVTSNITPPAIHVGKQVIYFLPDVALIEDGKQIGAVGYADLSIIWQESNFIEDGQLPRDAQVVGQTWKHPNKNGGPDRRFNDNRKIPICRYEVMHLTSHSGVNELVEFSKTGVAQPFASALKKLPINTALSRFSKRQLQFDR
jgi:hypothetical protein